MAPIVKAFVPRLAAALTAVLLCAGAAQAQTLSPQMSDAFVNSIGVNTHLTYNNTNYGNTAAVISAIRALGVRHIREGLDLDRPDQYAALQQLAADGVHATLIMGYPGFSQLSQLVSTLAQNVPSPDAVEGANEWDNAGGPGWISADRSYSQQLDAAMRAQPGVGSVPVLGPSVANPSDVAALGPLGSFVDGTAIHPYPWAQMPEDALSAELPAARADAPDKPVQVTETGYNNWLGSYNPYAIDPGVSDRASAIYLPRMFFYNFAHGVQRTFSYELLDETLPPGVPDAERNFGLLNSDFSAKPAYTTLQRVISLLSDPGPSFATSPLSISFSGAPSDLQELLLQRRNGTYELVLWRAESVWNFGPQSDAYPASSSLTVQLPRSFNWSDYVPNQSASPAVGGSGTALTVPVSSSVSILTLTPTSPPQTGTPSAHRRPTGAKPAAAAVAAACTLAKAKRTPPRTRRHAAVICAAAHHAKKAKAKAGKSRHRRTTHRKPRRKPHHRARRRP